MAEKFEFLLKWRSKLTKYVITHPLIKSRNLAFVCTKPADNSIAISSIFAFAAGTGGLVWEYTFENTSISGIELYESKQSKKQLCVLSLTSNDFLHGFGEVVAFNPAGEIEWRVKLTDKTVSAPIIDSGRLFVTDGGDSLTGINLDSHEIIFEHAFEEIKSSLSAVAINEQNAFVPSRSEKLLSINLESGQPNWTFALTELDEDVGREWLDKTPTLDQNVLYAVSTRGRIVCIDQENGKPVWHKHIESKASLTQPTVGPRAVFLGSKSGVFAIDKHNGKPLWQHQTTRRVTAQPQLIGNLLFVNCHDHFVYVLHAQTGEVIASFEMERRIEIPPLIASDSIYIVDRSAELKVFKFSPSQADLQPEVSLSSNTPEEAKRLAKAGKWLEAAKIYEIIDDYPARANALEEYARFISTSDATDHDKAAAWEKAADAFTESGDSEKKRISRREVARHRKQPLFEIELQESVFTLESWSRLHYKVKNIGFGLARFVTVLVKPETVLFEWQADSTHTSFSLQSDKNLEGAITIRPLNTGNSVPLDLIVEYMDVHDNRQLVYHTFTLCVMRNQDEAERMIRERNFDGRGIAETPIELRNIMVEAFDRQELDDIIYELDFNIDDFPGPLNTAAREFIDTIMRKGMTDKLIDIILREREYLKN